MIILESNITPTWADQFSFIKGNTYVNGLFELYPYYIHINVLGSDNIISSNYYEWLKMLHSEPNEGISNLEINKNKMTLLINESVPFVIYRGMWFKNEKDAAHFKLMFTK